MIIPPVTVEAIKQKIRNKMEALASLSYKDRRVLRASYKREVLRDLLEDIEIAEQIEADQKEKDKK